MADSTFMPELGHIAFGQPWQQHEAPEYLESALEALSDWFYRHRWTDPYGHTYERYNGVFSSYFASPFENSGARFKNEVFEVDSYSWSDEEQPYNFKYKDLEVSWYKWLGRDTTCNLIPSQTEVDEMLDECLKSLGE